MRVIRSLVFVLLIATPRFASAQSFVVQGSAGPTLIDSGYSLAGGIGVSPTSHLTVLFDLERTHLSSRLTSDGRGGVAGFRGGTLTLHSTRCAGGSRIAAPAHSATRRQPWPHA